VDSADCQWRLLSPHFPPWQTVYHHFRGWSSAGLRSALNDRLIAGVREAVGQRSRPTATVLDSQTVRSDPDSLVPFSIGLLAVGLAADADQIADERKLRIMVRIWISCELWAARLTTDDMRWRKIVPTGPRGGGGK
jgi:transposase